MIDDDLKLDFFFYFRETHKDATIKCYPTFVSKLPSGRETGRFLALDLGGTNFRVLQIDIGDDPCVDDNMIFHFIFNR